MKILIVDDEVWMRRGIRSMLSGSFPPGLLIEEADDGIAALERLSDFRPDVVIVDIRMPGMDGLSFIDKAAPLLISAQFIIVSGYSDFKYALEAIKLHACNYLLKPIDREQLLESVRNAFAIKREADHMKKQTQLFEKSAAFMKESWIQEWMEREHSAVQHPSDLFGVDPRNCAAACISIRGEIGGKGIASYGLSEKELALFTLRNYAIEWLTLKSRGAVFEYNGALNVLLLSENGKGDLKMILPQCMDNLDAVAKKLKFFSVRMSCSPVLSDGEALRNAVRHSLNALKRDIFIQPDGPGIPSDMDWKENQLQQLIYVGDCEGIRMNIENGLRIAAGKQDSISALEQFIDYLRLLLDKWTMEDSSNPSPSGKTEIQELLRYDDLEQLTEGIAAPFRQLSEERLRNRQPDGKRAAEETMAYIQTHYGEDISLTQLAQKYHLTPAYLSDIFKEVVGMNFVSYLTKVRMAKAGEFLKLYGIQVGQIAGLVGYEDERYFSTLFKKTYGITPTEFRKSHLV
ncbi:response regulator transcription factor [Cohnella silvisoli]|uniref:Response regulator n=1 Tax=Cohnella silvisoli TaxID=2873699 RepID=A0ABV1KXJ8_9BACL|nr:response regulator [Cohnella silvisoli]MCD9024189.1 response regulator [Cohnella silvisoli]